MHEPQTEEGLGGGEVGQGGVDPEGISSEESLKPFQCEGMLHNDPLRFPPKLTSVPL